MARTKRTKHDAKISKTRDAGGKHKHDKKTKTPDVGVKKPHRWRPGTVALREIRRYQRSTEKLVPRAPFKRLVHEITQEKEGFAYRWQKGAIDNLHESFEAYLVQQMQMVNALTLANKKVTITADGLRAANEILEIGAGQGSAYYKEGTRVQPRRIHDDGERHKKKKKERVEKKSKKRVATDAANAAVSHASVFSDDDDENEDTSPSEKKTAVVQARDEAFDFLDRQSGDKVKTS